MGTVTRLFDGLANILTGRGTTADRSSFNFWARRFTTPEQIENAYLGSWLHRKIVDIPAQDMVRAGRDWDAEDDQIAAIEKEEKRLGYWAKLYEALTLGRLGGGAILIGLGDRDPSAPLPADIGPNSIRYLTVLSRWQLTIGEMELDPESDNFGQPRYFRLSGSARQIDIHPSRVVCFKGLPIPAIRMASWEDRFWGMSVVEAVDEAVQQATTACSGFASLIDEAKVDVFRFDKMAETLAQPGGDERIMKRVELTNTGKSIHRAVILDKDDEWDQRQLTLTGVRDVIITYDARVAGAADIPATRLFGKAPDGMNATGEGDDKGYRDSIAAKQDMQLRPAMEKLDAATLPSAGVPNNLTWKFSGLSSLSEKDEAEIEAKEVDSIVKLATAALIPESALAKTVQNRLIESQRWPGLKKLIEEAEADGELPGDDDDLDIIPVNREEVIPKPSAGSGGQSGSGSPARRAANDATPRTLYVSRKVENVAEIKAWAKSQGLPELQDDLHVTLIYSRTPIDWMKVESDEWGQEKNGNIEIAPGGVRIVEPLGDRTAVLLFTSSRLSWRHEQIVRAGAEHGFPDYQPHISLTGEPVDLTGVEPYRGKIVLGPEVFEELKA